ncbi:hypothetical protein ACOMHN_008187 [Nucella lapillus]
MSNFSSDDFGILDNTLPRTNLNTTASYPAYQAALFIWKAVPPCTLLLGCFGNISTIFVMRRIKDHNSSQHAILMALAVSDLTLICSDMTAMWVKQVFYEDLWTVHVVACKLFMWVTITSCTTSAWLVTCVTVQRTMAVLWPHRMRVMCTLRRTWIVVATLIFSSCAFYFHLVLGREINADNVCYAIPGTYQQFFEFVFPWTALCVASVVPSVCLFVCDIILSVTLFKAVSPSSIAAPVDSNVSSRNTDVRRKTSYRTTVMVLAISFAFVVLTTPEWAYLVWYPHIYEEANQNPQLLAAAYLVHSVTYNVWYLNSAINFLLYCLTGTKFRREFMKWTRCGAQSPSAPSVHETASGASGAGRHKRRGNSSLSS